MPRHGGVVGVPHGYQAAGPGDPAHLAQRSDRVGEVLQHLVGVHDVVGPVGQVEVQRVANGKPDLRQVARRVGLRDDVGRAVHAEHLAVGADQGAEVTGDGAGTASDVEDAQTRPQVRQQVPGGVVRGTPAVRAQDTVVVPLQVGGHAGNVPLRLTMRNSLPTS